MPLSRAQEAYLKERHYVSVPFAVSESVLNGAMAAFFKFFDLPEGVKNHIRLTIAPKHRRGWVGFTHRDSGEHVYNDSKDFFHYHPAILEEYPDFIKENPVVQDFIAKAHPIWEEMAIVTKDVLSTFEKDFPGAVDRVFDTKWPFVVLRFLKYNWQESGKYLAKPHFDAGSFTFAIKESCAGLRIGSGPDDLKPVEHQPGHALFMCASNMKKVIDTEELKPGWHDVVQLDDTQVGKPYARWALVAFIEAHGVEALSRSETHKHYKIPSAEVS